MAKAQASILARVGDIQSVTSSRALKQLVEEQFQSPSRHDAPVIRQSLSRTDGEEKQCCDGNRSSPILGQSCVRLGIGTRADFRLLERAQQDRNWYERCTYRTRR